MDIFRVPNGNKLLTKVQLYKCYNNNSVRQLSSKE